MPTVQFSWSLGDVTKVARAPLSQNEQPAGAGWDEGDTPAGGVSVKHTATGGVRSSRQSVRVFAMPSNWCIQITIVQRIIAKSHLIGTSEVTTELCEVPFYTEVLHRNEAFRGSHSAYALWEK
jgi:hypothetical protein